MRACGHVHIHMLLDGVASAASVVLVRVKGVSLRRDAEKLEDGPETCVVGTAVENEVGVKRKET
ncbi:MAG: hypothetical protein QXX87_03075 [Candidatus Jordarchaeales archaeon]